MSQAFLIKATQRVRVGESGPIITLRPASAVEATLGFQRAIYWRSLRRSAARNYWQYRKAGAGFEQCAANWRRDWREAKEKCHV